jgi:hypothetical protein
MSRGGYFFFTTNTMSVANATANVNASYVVINTTPFLTRVWLTVP